MSQDCDCITKILDFITKRERERKKIFLILQSETKVLVMAHLNASKHKVLNRYKAVHEY